MCHPDEQMLLQELHGSVACSLPIPLIPNTSPQFKLIGLKTNRGKSQLIPGIPGETRDAREPQSLFSNSFRPRKISSGTRLFLLLRKFFFFSCQHSEIFAWLDKTQDSLGNHLVKLLRTVKLKFTDNANSGSRLLTLIFNHIQGGKSLITADDQN